MKIQGMKKYYNKEGYIVEIIKNKKHIFKDIIGSNINDIHVEVRLNKNKIRVDLICKSEEESLVFVEVSIRHECINDFVNHRNQLISILEFIGKDKFAQIILMAPDFLNEDINDIENLISSYNIEVYFVYIPTDFFLKFQNEMDIDSIQKKKLTYNKSIIGKCIKVTSRIVNRNNVFLYPLNNEQCGKDITRAILEGLRQELYWHLAVHSYKDLSKNIIRIGTGTSDIILNIYCNMDDKIIVEVDFAKRLNVFNIFKDFRADMAHKIGSSIYTSPTSSKIFTEIPMFTNKDTTITTTINTAKRYIEYLTKMYKIIQL